MPRIVDFIALASVTGVKHAQLLIKKNSELLLLSNFVIRRKNSCLPWGGVDFRYIGSSTTNGASVYFKVSRKDGKGDTLKFRISDHSVTNRDRVMKTLTDIVLDRERLDKSIRSPRKDHKYIRRWMGNDGKWDYEYVDSKGNKIIVYGEEENAAMQRKMLRGYRLETPKKKQRLEEFHEGRRMKGSYQGNTLQALKDLYSSKEMAQISDVMSVALPFISWNSTKRMWEFDTKSDGSLIRHRKSGVDFIKGSDRDNRGVDHKIGKHIARYRDFKSIEELAEALDLVAEEINGGLTPDSCFRLENRRSIKHPQIVYTDPSGYRVVFSANVISAGTPNESMRWVLITTYDKSSPLDEKKNSKRMKEQIRSQLKELTPNLQPPK